VSSNWEEIIASGKFVGGDIIFWERTDSCRGRTSGIYADSSKLWVEPEWLALPAGSDKKYRWYEVLPRVVYLDRSVPPSNIGLGRLRFTLLDGGNAFRPVGSILPRTDSSLLDFELVHPLETRVSPVQVLVAA
jgi:hypothetical protein